MRATLAYTSARIVLLVVAVVLLYLAGARGLLLLARQARLVAEPGGAAAVAAWLYHRDELPGAGQPAAGPAVAVVSGGNVDPGRLAAALAGD